MKSKRLLGCLLCGLCWMALGISSKAQELESEDIVCEELQRYDRLEIFESELVDEGVLDEDANYRTSFIIGQEGRDNAGVNALSSNKPEIIEAVLFENYEDGENTIVIPYEQTSSGLQNVKISAVQSKNFNEKIDSYVNVTLTATYDYYSASDTAYNGPFFRPTLLRAKCTDKTAKHPVKQLYGQFCSAGHKMTLSNYNVGSIMKYSSTVNKINPSNGFTYVGNNINMGSNYALSMYFNGIDTYSYVYGYVVDSNSKKT